MAVVVAACASKDSERIAALEKRVQQLDEDQKADYYKLLNGIADVDNKLVARSTDPQWWCFSLYCKRTEEECESSRTKHLAAWRSSEEITKSLEQKCALSRLAFCQGQFCYRDLGACLIKERENPSWACLGVE